MTYFKNKMNKGLKVFFLHKILTSMAVQFAGSFSIIFLYGLFDNTFSSVILFYTVLALFSIILVPSVGGIIN
jgi:hypothetical protein